MPGGGHGHTTVIQRVLERRGQKPPTSDEGTTATVAVMVRVLPPPKALLAFQDTPTRALMEQRVRPDMLDYQSVADEAEALRLFEAEFRPVVLTDSPEIIRRIRARPGQRAAYILYVAEIDDSAERETGLTAGADDCVGRRVSEREFEARVGAAKRIAELEAVVRITLAENRKLSATDDLTKVASRRFFGKTFPREVERAARYGRPLSLILCDIDHFKKINDHYGHASGDAVLVNVVQRITATLRPYDLLGRYGGEEFLIIAPGCDLDLAQKLAERIRTAVGDEPVDLGNECAPVSLSLGVTLGTPESDPEFLVAQADTAMYQAKRKGRNRVEIGLGLPDEEAALEASPLQ